MKAVTSSKLLAIARKKINRLIEPMELTKERRATWDTEEARLNALKECEKIVANTMRREKRREKKEVEDEEISQEAY